VAYYQGKTESFPEAGVSTKQVAVKDCDFFNIYQTSTTTNNYMVGGGRDILFENNNFDYLRGSVKFAGRVAGSRNIKLKNNIIKSSDNHGFEIDSQADMQIDGNTISNVFNQGIFMLSNNGLTNVSGILIDTTNGSANITATSSAIVGTTISISGISGSKTVSTVNSTTSFTMNGTYSTTVTNVPTNLPGVLASTTSGSADITLISILKVGMLIRVVGVTGIKKVTVANSATSFTLSSVCDASVTNAQCSLFGLGVQGFAYDGLFIRNNIFDNAGMIGSAAGIRMSPDTYVDGLLFDYKGVTIDGNIFRNVTNTSNIGINITNGSYVGLSVNNNKFYDYQGANPIWLRLRTSSTATVNGISVSRNNIVMDNGSGVGIRVEKNTGTNQINGLNLEGNIISGTNSRNYILGDVNNARMTNPSDLSLISGGFGLQVSSATLVNNFTIDGQYYLTRTTTNATPASLLWDGSTPTAKILIDNNKSISFSAMVLGRDTSGNSGSYRVYGLIKRGANAAATAIVGSVTTDTIAEDTAGWDVTAVADTTNGALDIQVTGAAATTIRWRARVTMVDQL